ncbi:CTTNBP2 [Symbiodinium microadriaticum]|nr:CTTNBP2 [Symbiodinium microadriaticum]
MGLCHCRRGQRSAKKRKLKRGYSASSTSEELDSEGDDDEVPARGCCPRARKQAPKFLRPPRTAEDNLRKASADGAVSTVQALLASRVQATAATENGYTALHAAAAHGRSKIVSMLLNAEAQVDCTASGGVTPLMLAAMGGHKATLEALLSAKASLHQELRGVRRGKSLLKIVIIRAHDIVR